MMTIREFRETLTGRDRFDGNLVSALYADYVRENIKVGDGATVHYWSDAEAYTVIKRTGKTLTLRRDKATLKESFKPEFVVGGFAAHCLNQEEQEYDYEPDPDGRIVTAYWSERRKGFYVEKTLRVSAGRHEFYDYNF